MANYPIAKRRRFGAAAAGILVLFSGIFLHFLVFEIATNNAAAYQNSCSACSDIQNYVITALCFNFVCFGLQIALLMEVALDYKLLPDNLWEGIFALSFFIPLVVSTTCYVLKFASTGAFWFDNSIQFYSWFQFCLVVLFMGCAFLWLGYFILSLPFVFVFKALTLCLSCCTSSRMKELCDRNYRDDPRGQLELALELVNYLPEGESDCSICKEPFIEQEKESKTLSKIISCGHTFHTICVEGWVNYKGEGGEEQKENRTCPLCRNHIVVAI